MGKRSKRTHAPPRRAGKADKNPVSSAPTITTERLARGATNRTRELAYIGVILAVALAIRLVYFYINSRQNPLFFHPVLDARFHHDWASEILSGNFWGDQVFFRAPLYPYLLALIYKISSFVTSSSTTSGTSMTLAVFVQHVIGSITCALVYLLGRQFFAARVALAAGLLAALYWPLIYFEGDLLIVTLIVFLNVMMLLLLTLAVGRERSWLFVLAGVIGGLSAIARPSILIFVPVIPLALYLMRRSQKPSAPDRAWVGQSALVALGLLVVISPIVVRNYVVGRDFVPIASQGGVNFYIGNNPFSNGSLAQVPGARADLYGTYHGAIDLAEKEAGRPLKPSEVSNHYFGKGLDFILSSPGQAAELTLKKLYLFWAGVERSNSKYIQFFWHRFGLGRIPLPGFWLIGPLGLLGGVLLWRRRRELSLPYLFVLSYMVGVVAFFVNGRFRLPAAPVLIRFAGYALCYLYSALRSNSRDLAKALAVLAVCVVVVDYDFVSFRGVRALDEAISHYELGNAYIKMDRKREALAAFERAHAIQQRYPTRGYLQIAGTVDYHIGVLYKERGYASRAVEALERIRPDNPAAVAANRELAVLYEQTRRFSDAIRAHQTVLAAVPRDAESLIGLARVYKSMGDIAGFEEALSRLRTAYPNDSRIEAEIRRLETNR
jgi:tetratricopeptide (TPR) repeat protein